MMNRHFLVMAVTGGSLLVADFVIGLFATGDLHGPGAVARGVHILFSLATVVVLCWVFIRSSTRILSRPVNGPRKSWLAYQLPDWINAQAKKNKRRAFRFIMWSMTAIAVAAWLGARGRHPGLDLFALAPRASRHWPWHSISARSSWNTP